MMPRLRHQHAYTFDPMRLPPRGYCRCGAQILGERWKDGERILGGGPRYALVARGLPAADQVHIHG